MDNYKPNNSETELPAVSYSYSLQPNHVKKPPLHENTIFARISWHVALIRNPRVLRLKLLNSNAPNSVHEERKADEWIRA